MEAPTIGCAKRASLRFAWGSVRKGGLMRWGCDGEEGMILWSPGPSDGASDAFDAIRRVHRRDRGHFLFKYSIDCGKYLYFGRFLTS